MRTTLYRVINVWLFTKRAILLPLSLVGSLPVFSQSAMINVESRKSISLNGKWEVLIDQFSCGEQMRVYLNKKPTTKTDFFEYCWDSAIQLDVPGDFNSQLPELKYYESSIWYKRDFVNKSTPGSRSFIYFGAVNYRCQVYVNGRFVGDHEGGFTPFQFEVSQYLKEGDNFVVVQVNNQRSKDAIPALKYDWWNYGGITRDVCLIETPKTYVHDYSIQLEKGSSHAIRFDFSLNGQQKVAQPITVSIPELGLRKTFSTDDNGCANGVVSVKSLQLWSPTIPKLYKVVVERDGELMVDEIGFRTIETRGMEILLNGKPVFLKGVNIHDEIPQRRGRAFSEADAAMLLREAQAVGANFIRLTHYPASEIMVRMAEKMGFMLWEEIPLWQNIHFDNPKVQDKAQWMLREMIQRDKNRCAIIFWSLCNETAVSESRNKTLTSLAVLCRELDPTRLITSAFNNVVFNASTNEFTLNDPFADCLDVVSVNKYLGWYMPWPASPEKINWNVCPNKPFLYSEYGCESQFGNSGAADVAGLWSEEYQEKLYADHCIMFDRIRNLRGVSPWVLYDFRSPYRMHKKYQDEWNRKGIVSDKGFRKKAWYVLRDYFKRK